jgi:hypothetical protein
MAAPSTVLTLIKRFTYRGNTAEEWSNTYALTGATPTDSAAWRTLFDALVAEEKKLYPNTSSVVGGYGYDRIPQNGDHAIWSVDMTVSPNSPVPGTLAAAGDPMSGDQASWVRWGLDRYNSNGKRVYLRKYFHGAFKATGSADGLHASYVTALGAFGAKLDDGSFASSRKICDKDSMVPIGHAVSPFVTTRTLKRRGKRPPT